MKRFLLATLPLLLSSAALAQPDLNAQGMDKNPPVAVGATPVRIVQETPVSAVRSFIAALNNPWEPGLATTVAGARIGYYGEGLWEKARVEIHPFSIGTNLVLDDVTVDAQTANDATVTVMAHKEFRTGNGDDIKRGEIKKYTLQLRREEMPLPGEGAGKDVWRVVPLTTEAVLKGPLLQLPPLSLAATLALRDPQLAPLLQQQLAANQLKQLGLGALQFAQDYQDVYAFDDQAHERALTPYIRTPQLFTIVGTKDEKWRFNDLLASRQLASLPEPARTVLFYDGAATATDSLRFRFGDKTLICFADGHVKAFAKDELKDIIWAPTLENNK